MIRDGAQSWGGMDGVWVASVSSMDKGGNHRGQADRSYSSSQSLFTAALGGRHPLSHVLGKKPGPEGSCSPSGGRAGRDCLSGKVLFPQGIRLL